ncbi:MAG: aminoglycoside 6-adenylyltransferase [Bacillota bacterium]
MRTENEMMAVILETAKYDERIRAVYMNGSRTNTQVPKDIFQDYDIVYGVSEMSPFIEDNKWLESFGNLLMIQEPDNNDHMAGKKINSGDSYGYLMLFADGNRIDLQLQSREGLLERYLSDKLTIPLMDKDNVLPSIEEPTDIDYHVKKPSESEYAASCNNFWWCQQNVVKGIWRDELPYAKYMFECIIRHHLDEVVSWWIGSKTDFGLSSGKLGKYFKKHLPDSLWKRYCATYSDGNYENFWEAIFTACFLFRELAREVAHSLSYTYPEQDDLNMTGYMERVRHLPRDAERIF